MNARFLGIEIGGTKLQCALGDGSGRIEQIEREQVNPEAGAAGIRRQIASAWQRLRARGRPAAVGVGFGGPVDWRAGRVICSHHVPGWDGFPLGQWLEELVGAPAAVENDANTAALAEALAGAGRDADPLFYVTMGSGVGGGLVAGGRVYHGAPPGEAEIGHVRLDREGTTVEARCSGWATDRRVRRLAAERPESALARRVAADPGREARHLLPALEEGDPNARKLIEETASDLAFALSHVAHLFHPAAIVLGGGLSLIGEPLRAAVAKALPDWLMKAFHPGPEIRLAELGEQAVPAGALILAAQKAAG